MIAVLPFINRILEHCKESKVFKPSNPWVQSILCLAAEIYALDNLKLNLKFEIETMFRSQNDMKPSDVTASNTLGSHKRETVTNPDFGADKAPASPAQPPPPPTAPPGPQPTPPATPPAPPKPEADSKAPAGMFHVPCSDGNVQLYSILCVSAGMQHSPGNAENFWLVHWLLSLAYGGLHVTGRIASLSEHSLHAILMQPACLFLLLRACNQKPSQGAAVHVSVHLLQYFNSRTTIILLRKHTVFCAAFDLHSNA